MVPELESMGIEVLLNESVKLTRGGGVIHLAGVDDAHYYRVDNIEKAAEGIPLDGLSILLSHTPEIYRQAAHSGFDLFFCGHTHGGQICLPGGYPITLDARCPRRLGYGNWQYGEMRGYTSAGAGTSIVEVRLNCLPEIVLHTLERSSADAQLEQQT
jgi:predicted MPP superfamily phosphohydrolase